MQQLKSGAARYSPHLTAASQLLQRHQANLGARNLLFSGDLSDNFCCQLTASKVQAYTYYYQQARRLAQNLGNPCVNFSLLPNASLVSDCDRVVYYWPKNKMETQLQIYSLLAMLPLKTEWWFVGEQRCGIRQVETLLAPFGPVTLMDYARRCRLYHFQCHHRPNFSLADYWGSYEYQGLTIKTLPAVFSRGGLDLGSQLLLEHLTGLRGRALDLGCGAGVLGAVAQQRHPEIQLTFCDVHCHALAASQATLNSNQLTGSVLLSDGFSELSGPFEEIVVNPPFHQGRVLTTQTTETWIQEASNYLSPGGRLWLVANRFLPYAAILDRIFGKHQRLADNSQFVLYQATNHVKKIL
ncbi:MAG: 16S rRNA (guanine(1207)-N(2))-methyltransferase RsmC [Candidatus Symbiodolus clandestinus]